MFERMGGHHFLRLKISIGRPPPGTEAADYVLDTFDQNQQPELDLILSQTAEAVRAMHQEGSETAMNQFQKRKLEA